MKIFVLLVLLGVSFPSRAVQIYSSEKAEIYFEEFIITYQRQYADKAEKQRRFEIFKQNLEVINKKNSANDTAVFGITKFSDLTQQEFIDKFTGSIGDKPVPFCGTNVPFPINAPDAWDWRDKGVISPPKDQGPCGAYWAFSAIGNLEAHYAIKHKEMVSLSVQQLVDCDQSSDGCHGSSDESFPFLYLLQNGSMLEKDYPYKGVAGSCQYDASKVKLNVSYCISYKLDAEEDLRNIVHTYGPLSITIDAVSMTHYRHGILGNCPGDKLNHVALLVGYGTEKGTPYWVIKNSWGTDFGEDGFIKIKRGVNACGLMNTAMIQGFVN